MIEMLIGAFIAGALGGVHCVGMCGGIVGAIGFGLPEQGRKSWLGAMPYLLAYNGGRIGSYVVAGAVAGTLGATAMDLVALNQAQRILQFIAALFMMALGLYLGGWWFGITKLEKVGSGFWELLAPVAKRLLPVTSPRQALLLGILWGWLPCGLVYTHVIWALSAGGTEQGALLLLAFGLGTLPNLMAMGLAAGKVSAWMRQPLVRRAGGALVFAFGVWMLLRAGIALP